jgi:hypothetical protein
LIQLGAGSEAVALGGTIDGGAEVEGVGAAWLGVADGGTGEDHRLGATDDSLVGATAGRGDFVSAEATVDGEALGASGDAGTTEEHEIVPAATARQNRTRNNRIAIVLRLLDAAQPQSVARSGQVSTQAVTPSADS